GPHRVGVGAVHFRVKGGGGVVPRDREGDPPRSHGSRSPPRRIRPPSPARRRRGEEALVHREVHPPHRRRPPADPRPLERATEQDGRGLEDDPRAHPEGLSQTFPRCNRKTSTKYPTASGAPMHHHVSATPRPARSLAADVTVSE